MLIMTLEPFSDFWTLYNVNCNIHICQRCDNKHSAYFTFRKIAKVRTIAVETYENSFSEVSTPVKDYSVGFCLDQNVCSKTL